MRWNDTILSDDTSLNVTSIAFGNNYYVALAVRVVSDEYHVDILYTNDLNNEWTTKTIYNSGADPIIVPGIVFTGSKFVIPFTTNLSNSFSALYFDTPSGNVTTVADIFQYAHPIHVNSVRFVGGKLMVCGNVQTGANDDNISGYTWYCTDPAGVWEAYEVIQYSDQDNISGNAQAPVFNTTDNKYMVYGVAKQDQNTNIHRIYSSGDLENWDQPREVVRDTKSALPFPAFAYCEDYDAVALFLHGQIYVSKAGQRFVTIPYPGDIGAESIRAVTSDGTKFLASSASDHQANLKVIYSSGDPTVAANWRVQTLAEGQQISSDVKFIDDTDLFIVVAGQSSNVKPTIYTALFAANEFNIMKDRVPTYPGRVSLTSLGQNLYNLARADEPTEEGTKLSKVNLLSDDAALAVWNNTPPDILCTPSTALEHLGNNAFHVGDILTTARDLSGDANWLKCTGGDVSQQDYPELYPLLQTGSVEGDWSTNVIDDSTGYASPNNCNVATDGEWYVMIAAKYNSSNSTYDYYVYYTRDPSGTWTKKTIVTGSNWQFYNDVIPLIYANGYFAFLVTEYTTSAIGNSFVVYADEPSGTWNTMQIGVAGRWYQGLKYLNGKYLTWTNYNPNGYYTDVLTFDEIGGQVTTNTIMNNAETPTQTYDINYYDGKWYAVWHQSYTSGSSYITNTRLYYSDTLATVYSAGQYGQVEYASSSSGSSNYFYPENLTCGNGYYVLWGYRSVSSGQQNGLLDIYYSNDVNTFTRMSMPQYSGMQREASIPIFFDGAFYITLRGVSDSKPYILYGADPTNLTAKLLFNGNIYRPSLAASEATKTLFAGTQGQNYTTLTAAWQKVGKSLPKLSPGVGLNAYIKAKEGD